MRQLSIIYKDENDNTRVLECAFITLNAQFVQPFDIGKDDNIRLKKIAITNIIEISARH